MIMITVSRLRDLLLFDPETGVFEWAVSLGNNVRAGDTAGTLHDGYVIIRLDGRAYKAHRLAWLYVYGKWPVGQIDHRNGITDDNTITNLREATSSQNQQNVAYRGVHQHKGSSRWTVRIQRDGQRITIGSYATEQEALASYHEAKREIHPFWEGR